VNSPASLTLPTTATPLDAAEEGALRAVTLHKVSRRLLPLLFVLYVCAFLDRINVGFAALHMNSDLEFSATTYGLGSGIFFVGYCLFEVPSNILLYKLGARKWIARIMVTWGIVASAMMFVRTPTSFYVLRFLLGVAEAGFFPGVIYYVSQWFPNDERARAISGFMLAIPVCGVIGGPVSGALLGLQGLCGLAGWQWLFLLEGLPSIALGAFVWLYLTDRPQSAHWLEPAERKWLTDTLATERSTCRHAHDVTARKALTNRMVWQLGIIYFFGNLGFYGYTLWAPQVIRVMSGTNDFTVGLISGAISLAMGIGMRLNGRHSDRRGERVVHVVVPLLVMGMGFLGSVALPTPLLSLLALALIPIGMGASYGPFWSMPSLFLTGEAAARGIALITSIMAASGFVGPTLIGVLKSRTGGYQASFLFLALAAGVGALLAWPLRREAALRGTRSTDPG
jgi:MFS transporter, ACS family, tartrate transporter